MHRWLMRVCASFNVLICHGQLWELCNVAIEVGITRVVHDSARPSVPAMYLQEEGGGGVMGACRDQCNSSITENQ